MDGPAVAREPLSADGQQVRHARERDGHRVQIHPEDTRGDAGDSLPGRQPLSFGRGEVAPHGMEEKGARAACRVEHPLLEGTGDDLVDDTLGEPVGRVILAHLLARLGRDDGLVEHLEHIVLHAAPVEAAEPPR